MVVAAASLLGAALGADEIQIWTDIDGMHNNDPRIVSGTTDTLVEISGYLYNRNPDGAHDTINRLAAQYRKTVAELYSTDEYKAKAASYVKGVFDYITSFTKTLFGEQEEKIILAQGELISTHLMAFYLMEKGINVALLSALDFMRIDFHGEPDAEYIKEHATAAYDAAAGADLYVTQGFICRIPARSGPRRR